MKSDRLCLIILSGFLFKFGSSSSNKD